MFGRTRLEASIAVQEGVFGVLALEIELVDPRLSDRLDIESASGTSIDLRNRRL